MKSLNKGVSAIGIIITLVIAGLIVGGIYFYFNSRMPKTENIIPASSNSGSETNATTTDLTQEDLAKLSPKEMWLKLREEVDETENIDELFAVSRKYATKEKLAFWDSQMESYNSMAQSFKDSMFLILKTTMPTLDKINVEGIKTEIIGNKATLEIETKDSKEKAEVTLIKEDGIWRFEEEVWGSK